MDQMRTLICVLCSVREKKQDKETYRVKERIRWSKSGRGRIAESFNDGGTVTFPGFSSLSLPKHFSLKSFVHDVVTGCPNSNSTRTLGSFFSPLCSTAPHCARKRLKGFTIVEKCWGKSFINTMELSRDGIKTQIAEWSFFPLLRPL